MTFPVFSSGNRRTLQNWVSPDTTPPKGLEAYTPEQVKLACVSQVSRGP